MIDKRTASFMRSLALGQIEEEILLPFPDPKLSEREALAAALRRIEELLGPRAAELAEWDRNGAMPPAFLDELRRAGLFGLVIPEPFGGMGLSATGYARVLQEIARHDASVYTAPSACAGCSSTAPRSSGPASCHSSPRASGWRPSA